MTSARQSRTPLEGDATMLSRLWSTIFVAFLTASGALTQLHASGMPLDDALRDSAQSIRAVACTSDDFNANNLNSVIWTFTDPLGNTDLTLSGTGTSQACLALSLPAGIAHDLYTGKNYAPRILQPCANTDFELEVKFNSPLSQLFQIQGVLIQGGANTLLRFDFSSDGITTNAYAASTSDGFATAPMNRIALTAVAPNNVAPLYMRVSRTGNSWSMYSSTNGTTYTLVGTFTFAMTVTQAGLFAGNGGPSVPAHTALFDYFIDRAAPIDPEDGSPVVDVLPPLAYNVASITGGTAMRVTWKTDERARSRLQYGRTTGYGTTVIDDTLRTQHSVMLLGLRSNTLYHFRVISTDSLNHRDTTANFRDTTYVRNPTVLTLWYGSTQTFGKIGTPQPFVNILGNATDPAGIDSLYYRLNGGAPVMLNWGPNARRLQRTGDFNIDLRYDRLQRGTNTVVLTSKNPFNERQDQTIIVRDSSGPVWPLPYGVTWSSAKSLSDSVQVVDGRWAVSSNKIHVVERGYDRNLGFGDTTWQDYVMTAKLSVSGFDSSLLAYSAPSNGPCIAFLMRWNGHTNNPIVSPQPLEGYLPLGAFAALSWPSVSQQKWELFGNGLTLKEAATSPMLEFNTAYMFKLQVTTIPGQGGFYRFKVWKASEAEPATWLLNAQEALTAPQRGSALIVAHHVTASVDEVSFTPVPADAIPPVITNVLTEVSATSAYISFGTDEPARASVSFGRSASYDSLAMSDTLLRLAHGIPIVGLTPNTNYHFSIVVTDNAGNEISTADAMFTTLPPAASTTLVTDEFNSTTLHPRWAPVDPLGDANFTTPDSVLTIALPGVISHELWVDGYHAPHVYQTANNTDVRIDVKWNSPITGTSTEYRTQGIVAEQDATNVIRFDYSSTATGTYMFAASFNNGFTRNKITIYVYSPAAGATGTQPLYMRVIREGHLWSQWYSTDGEHWTLASRIRHPLTLAGVSIFASNAGPNSPAFSSVVDYFRVNGQTTDVPETPAIPVAYTLEQNYPNPFNPSTTIRYGLPRSGRVTLSVYTILGQRLADLVNEDQNAGFHSVSFDGSRLASGVYFYRLKAGDYLATKQFLLLK